MTAADAYEAILAGKTVRVVVGDDPKDPILLHYFDRTVEDDEAPMIYSEGVGGWSEGIKEAVCAPESDFYVGWLADPPPKSIELTDEVPTAREAPGPVVVEVKGR